jgi:hypothetical protein
VLSALCVPLWQLSKPCVPCSAETRGQFEQQLKSIVRGTKTLDAVLAEDVQKYKDAFESAVGQSHVRYRGLVDCAMIIAVTQALAQSFE